jgi:GAG-pre-integrase domain
MAHQATKLPTKAPETINNVTKLSDKAGYDRWAFLIKCSLITVDCEDLIDTSIPRPAIPAPNDAGALLVYERWRKLSRTVMSWLVNQVDSHIIDELRQLPNIPQYADECFQAIKTIVVGQGHTELRSVWKRAVRMQRSQYGTIEQYVTAFRDAVQRANNLDLQITPWCAATLLLEELSKELPNWTAAVECAWPKDIHTKMKAQDWQQLCQDAIDRGRDYGSQMATLKKPRDSPLITSSPDSKKFPNDKNRDIKPIELGKAPPFGKNPDIYARELREKQLSFRRCCGHCGKEGHNTGTCYYLMVKKPRFYKPSKDIWCYTADTETKANEQSPPQRDTSNVNIPFLPDSSSQATTQDMPERMQRFCGAAVAASQITNTPLWIADSGSAYHLCKDRHIFVEYHEFKPGESYQYECSNGTLGDSIGKGTARIDLQLDDGKINTILVEAFYNPKMSYNLYATILDKYDNRIWHNILENKLLDIDTGNVVGYTYECSNIPFLRTANPVNACMAAISPLTLHRRLGHAGVSKIKSMIRKVDIQDILTGPIEDFHCEACRLAKSKRLVSRDPQPRRSRPGELFYADVQTIKPVGIHGYNYYLILVDDCTRIRFIRLLRSKGDAADELIEFNEGFNLMAGYYIQGWRMDNGSEFSHFVKWAKPKGIRIEPTPPRTPEPNGVPERHAGHINSLSRAMIIDANLPSNLWPYATETAVSVVNRLIEDGETESPVQKWRKFFRIPNPEGTVDHYRIWGCKAYMHIPKEDRTKALKMQPRAKIGRLVGYEGDHGHVYQIWFPDTGEVKRSRDVTFFEGDSDQDDDFTSILPTPKPKPPAPEGKFRVAAELIDDSPKIVDMIFQSIEAQVDDYIRQRVQTISASPEPESHRLEQRQAEDKLLSQLQQAADMRTEVDLLEFARNDLRTRIDLFASPSKPSPEPQESVYDFDTANNPRTEPSYSETIQPEPPVRASARPNKGKKPEKYGSEGQDTRTKDKVKGGGAKNLQLSSTAAALPLCCAALRAHEIKLPRSHRQAIRSPQAYDWPLGFCESAG